MDLIVQSSDLQLVLVSMIAVQWWTLSQYVPQHRFFRCWAWGWGWLAILIAISRISLIVSGTGTVQLPFRMALVLAGLIQLYYFALGAWYLRGSNDDRFHLRLAIILIAIALITLGLQVWPVSEQPAHNLAIRFFARNLGLAAVFVYSGWLLFRQRAKRQPFAYIMTSACLFGLGCHLGYYAAGDINTFVHWFTGVSLLPYDSTALLAPGNFLIDLALNAGIGIGTLLLLAEQGRQSTEALRNREAEFRATFNEAPTPIALIDQRGVIQKANRAMGDLLELPEAGLIGRELEEFLESGKIDHAMTFRSSWNSVHPRRYEVMLRSSSGREIAGFVHLSLLSRDRSSEPRFVAQILDMTEHRNLQERLSHLAMHDSVTGLPNRGYFGEQLHATVKRMQRRTTPLVVMFLDMNDFKKINDSFGHEAGDHLLQVIARRVTDSVRDGDFVARFGGDEFTVLLEECQGAEEAYSIAYRILDAVRQTVEFQGRYIEPSISIGVVVSSVGDEADVLLREADMAMYRAKRSSQHIQIVDRSEADASELRGHAVS